ncbi:MAG: peptide chain release factor N(5)-glutamine methyltransferase [Erythrobacter sp.]
MADVASTMREAAHRLSEVSDTPRLDAELLMADALGVTRSQMLIGHQTAEIPTKFAQNLNRRMRSEPVAYILGKAEFFGREFTVTPDVLIPRSDSEVLIETALELASNAKRVLDLGTGSGALLISAVLELPDASGIAIDASQPALNVALANAQRHGLEQTRAIFRHASWRSEGWAEDLGSFDLILCNPPYVEADAELDIDVRDFEPSEALFAGPDGLDDYRIIIPQLREFMNENAVAIFEIGHTQAEAVTEIAKSGGFATETRKDLANRPRCVILR